MNISASKPLKILVVHASHTGGHAAAAGALAEELNQHEGVQADSVNLLSVTSAKSQQANLRSHDFVSKRFPGLRKLGFGLAFSGNKLACGIAGLALDWKASRADEMLAEIERRQPDVIVATHSVTAHYLEYWTNQGKISAPVHCVPTDFRTHRMWKQDCVQHYYVAPGGSRQDLIDYGVAPEKIHETGIPIRPPVASGLNQADLRAKLGLVPDKPVVLISGGSLGLQPFTMLVKELRKRPEDFQIVCIAAKNEKARQELAELPQTGQPLFVTGLVNNMSEWIEASDIILTKPGGLTCSEILAQKKPMVFAQLYEGLETPLIERLVESGVAVAGPTAEATAAAVGNLFASPQRLQSMKDRAEQLSRPDSTETIAHYLLA